MSAPDANSGVTIGYRIVHVFPWGSPWSVIAVRDPKSLTALGRFAWK